MWLWMTIRQLPLSVYPLREGKLAKACLISRPNLFVFENQFLQIIFLGALSKAISQHVKTGGMDPISSPIARTALSLDDVDLCQ